MLKNPELIAAREIAVTGISLKDLNALKADVTSRVYQLKTRFNPSNFLPKEDIAQDCFTTLYMRNFFGKFDSTKSQISTYIYNGVKNFLIDQERGSSCRIKSVYMENIMSDNMNLSDIIDFDITGTAEKAEHIKETIDVLRSRKIRFKKDVISAEVEGNNLELSEYTVMHLKYVGYTIYEIADMFGVSSTYISRLFSNGSDFIKEHIGEEIKEKRVKKVVCPFCGKEEVRLYDISWTFYPWFMCRKCGKTFTLFTNTPLNNLRGSDRKKFLSLMIKLNSENISLRKAILDLNIDSKKGVIWAKKFWDHFKGESKTMIKLRLVEWSKFIEAAERRMKNKDYSKPKNGEDIKNWIQ